MSGMYTVDCQLCHRERLVWKYLERSLQLLMGLSRMIPKLQGGRSMMLFLSAKTASLTDHHVGGLSNGSCPATSLTIHSKSSFSNFILTDFSIIFCYSVCIMKLWFSFIIFFYSQKVSYVHDGSESTQDAVIFEIELSSSRPNSLDKEMRVRQRFRLQISIRPHNDVPKIEMGPALKGKYF